LHASFLQAWIPSLALTWNLPAWSVSVELAFYFVFPAIARALLRGSPRARIAALIGAWAASLAISVGYTLLQPDHRAVGPDTAAPFLDALKFWPPARLPEFVFGVALGTLYRSSWRVPRALGPLAVATLAVALAAHRVPYPVLHNSLLLPAFGAILVAVAAARGPLRRALSCAPLVQLGRSGYAIYILQMPLMYLVLLATHAGAVEWHGAGFMVRFTILVVATAVLVQRFVERPLQPRLEAWLRRRARPRRSGTREMAPSI
jgi:peptidoglycan/LPS O-acetylase OafA/YrhL